MSAIIDFFDRYPLITQKLADYLLFKQAFELIRNKEHLTIEGLNKLIAIKASPPLRHIQIHIYIRELYFLHIFFFKIEKKICKKYKSWPSSSSLSFPSFREEKRGKRIEEGIYIAFFPLFLSLSIERGERERRGIVSVYVWWGVRLIKVF